jgi:hypothetical protein
MRVSPHQLVEVVSDGTGREPEAVVLSVARAVAAKGVVTALHAADFVTQYGSPLRPR